MLLESRVTGTGESKPVDAQTKIEVAGGTPIADLKIDPATPLFRVRSFSLLFTTRVASTTATQMLAVGGVLYDLIGAASDYGICTLLFLAALGASLMLPNPPVPAEPPRISWATLSAGFRFIGRCQPVLGAMLLDFVSTFCGGVSALL